MNRNNNLYLIIGALVVLVIGLGIYVYREESKPQGVQINMGEGGITVEED